jgi:hypothetical protein
MVLPVHGATRSQHDLIEEANRRLQEAKEGLKKLKKSRPASHDEALLLATRLTIRKIKKAIIAAEALASIWSERIERTRE